MSKAKRKNRADYVKEAIALGVALDGSETVKSLKTAIAARSIEEEGDSTPATDTPLAAHDKLPGGPKAPGQLKPATGQFVALQFKDGWRVYNERGQAVSPAGMNRKKSNVLASKFEAKRRKQLGPNPAEGEPEVTL